MRRLMRAGLLASVLPSFYAGIALLLNPPGASAALLAVRPGPIDRPLHLTAGDFNRDGFDDLAVANYQAGTVTILINQKDGTFATQKDSPFSVGPASIASPSSGPLFLSSADLNPEDVDSDRVSNVLDNCPNVYNPPASGTTQTDSDGVVCRIPPIDPDCSEDSDCDGVPDFNSTTGVLDNCPLIPNPGQELEVAEGPDGICNNEDDNVFLYRDDGVCGAPAENKVSKVGAACSRSPDLVIVEATGGGLDLGVARIRVNDRTGGMRSRNSLPTSLGPAQAMLADFNADRRADLLISSSGSDTVRYFPGTADGEFGATQIITTGDGPEGMAAGDFDADLDLDLAVANRSAGTIGVYTNSGTALPLTVSTTLPARPGPTFLLAAPLATGDACDALVALDQGLPTCSSNSTNAGVLCKVDIDCLGGGTCVSATADVGTIEVFTNASCALAGPLALTTTITLGAGHRPRGGVLADLDGDCKADLAVADFTGGQVLIYAGDGTGGFVPAATPALTGLSSPSALALLNYDPDTGPAPDLAVLSYADNRVDLFHNDGVPAAGCVPGALAFSAAPTNPVSPWKSVLAISIFPADVSVGQDLAMLSSSPPRIDVLSGTGTTFRTLPPEPLTKISTASGMALADLRQDGALDLLVLDGPGNQVEVVTSEPTGLQVEGAVQSVGANPVAASVEPLVLHSDDYDQDGVPNVDDNCPTRYNPAGCPSYDKTGYPECFLDTPCEDQNQPEFATCLNPDPVTLQCDGDANGVGDQCQVLDADCQSVDTDQDNIPDYNPITKLVDNCPFTGNGTQSDGDGDGIGDACDGGICINTCLGGVRNKAACKSDVDCDPPVNDIVTVNAGDGSPGSGALSFLIGDASGGFRPAPASWSSVTGLSNPVAAAVGHLAYDCVPNTTFGPTCSSRSQNDLVVMEQGAPGSGDDALKLFYGNGSGSFTPPLAPVAPQTSLVGDPTRLLMAPDQRVCANPWVSPTDPRSRFDRDMTTPVLAALEPGTSSLGIILPGSLDLLAPPGNPNPLPIAFPPVDVQFVDVNQDDVQDLIVLSSGGASTSAPNVTIYIGMGNGLFFTDPVLNPAGVPDGMTLLAAGNINLVSDATYPDVALFGGSDQAPIILTNVLTDRADIDGSGRVDGYDLAVLARSFGAVRGENFTLQPDGTLWQTGSGATRTLVPGGCTLQDGLDLPRKNTSTGLLQCDRGLTPMTAQNANYCVPTDPNYLNPGLALYGLPVDINLDGRVDGTDLALLASRFGDSL
ncbi:MAG TPA: VCBS repeat-containing protein [Candidatus Polarisedimenticolia bacterium]|nr:VCBS repeat-containing protein [Candidatus Polarisedimenticolia bacterium]